MKKEKYDLDSDGEYLCTCVSHKLPRSKVSVETYEYKKGTKRKMINGFFATILLNESCLDLKTRREAKDLIDILTYILKENK